MSSLPISYDPENRPAPENQLGLIPADRMDEFLLAPEYFSVAAQFCLAVDQRLRGAPSKRVGEKRQLVVSQHLEQFQGQNVNIRSLVARRKALGNLRIAMSIIEIEGVAELYGELHQVGMPEWYVLPESVRPLARPERTYIENMGRLLLEREASTPLP